MIGNNTLKALLNLKIEKKEEKFWIIFDWLKREFFVLLKGKIASIDWAGNWQNDLEDIYNEVIEEWKQIENMLLQYNNFPVKRLKGVLYEALFYLTCIKTSSIFKSSWIMELAGDPLAPNEKPPWFEVIPIYDIIPRTFRIKEDHKWVLKAPQIEADFVISYWDEKGTLPLAFVDVKANLKKYNPKYAVWYALGCKWAYNAILEITCPKTDYPKDLKEWKIKQACWNCGSLNKNTVYCQNCGTKIWLAEEELWETYPLK